MRTIFFVTLFTLASASALAQGCPPWLPCGKYHNLISGDSGYDDAVKAATAAAAAADGNAGSSDDSMMEIEQRIDAAKAAQALAVTKQIQQTPVSDGGSDQSVDKKNKLTIRSPFFEVSWRLQVINQDLSPFLVADFQMRI